MRLTTLKSVSSINSSPVKNTRNLESSISFNPPSDLKQIPQRNKTSQKNISSLNISSLEQNIKFISNDNPCKSFRLNMPMIKNSCDYSLMQNKLNKIVNSKEFRHCEKKHFNQQASNITIDSSANKILCRPSQKESKPNQSEFLKKSSSNRSQISRIKKNKAKVKFIRILLLFWNRN